jgi:hypothetical protein
MLKRVTTAPGRCGSRAVGCARPCMPRQIVCPVACRTCRNKEEVAVAESLKQSRRSVLENMRFLSVGIGAVLLAQGAGAQEALALQCPSNCRERRANERGEVESCDPQVPNDVCVKESDDGKPPGGGGGR